MTVKCSVVIATYNKAWALNRVLESIRAQKPSFEYEVIVVNDGSSDDTEEVCEFYCTEYAYLHRPYFCGPAAAKNVGYRKAKGDIILCMNDDVMLMADDAMQRLCDMKPKTYQAGHVDEIAQNGEWHAIGIGKQMPLFFLTAVPRKHMYAVGGCDERFTMLNYEDNFLMYCLVNGRGLQPEMIPEYLGRHIPHERPPEHWAGDRFEQAGALFKRLFDECKQTGQWVASGGPWPYTNGGEGPV